MGNLLYKILVCIILFKVSVCFYGCKGKDSPPESSRAVTSSQENNDKNRFENMIFIPAGEFTMGNDMVKDFKATKKMSMLRKPMFMDEYPQRKVFVDAFYIDKYEVTNEEYKKFADDIDVNPLPNHWKDGTFPEGKGNHPVVYVNWYYATFYARWAKKRLPTETEWEKAARGTDARLWAWGNEYDPEKGNFGLNKIKDTTPVGSFPEDKSPFGLLDVTGNVKEWTADWYDAYPGNDFIFEDFGRKHRVVRGSSHIKFGHYYDKSYAMVTHRFNLDPRYAVGDVGFRCAVSSE